jgi:hypothetical protein
MPPSFVQCLSEESLARTVKVGQVMQIFATQEEAEDELESDSSS